MGIISDLLLDSKIAEEVKSFKLEYPEYNDEIVSDYIQLLDDFNSEEKRMFLRALGY